MDFRLVPNSETLNDLERPKFVILRYFTEFGVSSKTTVCFKSHNRRVRRLARLKVSLRSRFDRNGLISTISCGCSLYVRLSVHPSVCLSKTGDALLNGSTYRNAFYTLRESDVMRALSAVAELFVKICGIYI